MQELKIRKFKKKINFLKKTRGGNLDINSRDRDRDFLTALRCYNESESEEGKLKCIKEYLNQLKSTNKIN